MNSAKLAKIFNITYYRRGLLLSTILLIGLIVRLWQLGEIPGEMWGDVIEGYKFARQVLAGNFYWNYVFGGDGPLFSYLVAGLSVPLGLSFYTMKLVTVFVGVALVGVVYVLAKEYTSEKVALLAAFLTAVSKWSVIFSRMAKPHLLAALFAALSFVFLLRFLQRRNLFYGVLSGVTIGVGMYTQAAFWGVPLASGALLLVYYYIHRGGANALSRRRLLPLLVPLAFLTLPLFFDLIFRLSYLGNAHSFFGEKLLPRNGQFAGFLRGVGINLLNNLGMLHFRGGLVFRNNPPGSPQLDLFSGLFFLVGCFYGLRLLVREKIGKEKILSFGIPFFLLQVPSLLDVNNTAGPNAGRTIALIPWIYIVVAYSLWRLVRTLPKHSCYPLLAAFLLIIGALNFWQVFVEYPHFLPNENTPYGKIIAREIDKLPPETAVYVVGCCWGERGQPEPDAIRFTLNSERKIQFFAADNNLEDFSCAAVREKKRHFYIVVSPIDTASKRAVENCFPAGKTNIIEQKGQRVAWTIKT